MAAVLFDYYGVISYDPLRVWQQRHHLDKQQQQALQDICADSDAGISDLDSFYQSLGLLVGISASQVATELSVVADIDQNMLELVRTLRRSGIKTGIISNSGPTLTQSLDKHRIAHLFDEVVISADVGFVKPEPQIFEIAVQRLRSDPKTTMFFDDRPANIQGARQAGLDAILFTNAEQCRNVLSQRGLLPTGLPFLTGPLSPLSDTTKSTI